MNDEVAHELDGAEAEDRMHIATDLTNITVALLSALRKQPGIDAYRLLSDFLAAMPDDKVQRGGGLTRTLKEELKRS
jgi:hypothetical protein